MRRRWRQILLGVLLLTAGLALVPGRAWYQEYRLRRMSEPELAAWTARRPEDARGRLHWALALGRAGDPPAAERELTRALDLDPNLAGARWRLARIWSATGREREAEDLLQRGLQRDPRNDRLHAELGRLFGERRDFRLAAAAWEKAASLAPKEADTWYQLGRCRMERHEEASAADAYRRAVDLAPRSAAYRKSLAGALRLTRQYKEAERHARAALELAPGDAEAQFALARLLLDRDGPTPEAEAGLKRAVSLQPGNPIPRYVLASAYQARGDLYAAAREYRETLRLLRAREPPAASAAWEEREAWLAQIEGPLLNLGRVLQRLGRRDEAARYLGEFERVSRYRNQVHELQVRLAHRPNAADLHRELARLHAAAGAHHLAQEHAQARAAQDGP